MDQDRTPIKDLHKPSDRPNSIAFAALCVGHTLVVFSNAIFLVILTLLVYARSGSGAELGLVLAAGALPQALFLLPGGVLVDRTVPVRVARYAAWIRAVMLVLIAVLVAVDAAPTGVIIAITAVVGVADALYQPAAVSVLPQVVPLARLARGNSLLQGAESAGDLLGPILGAALVTAGGFVTGSGTVAALAVLSGVALVVAGRAVPGPGASGRPGSRGDAGDRAGLASAIRSAARELADGLRHAVSRPVLRTTLVLLAVLNLTVPGPVLVGGAVLADQRFGGAATLGVLLAGAGAGGLAGLLLAGLRLPVRRGAVLAGGSLVIGSGLTGLGFVDSLVLATTALVVIGLGSGYLGVVLVSWVQETTPEHLLGRTMSLVLFATVALDPLSFAVAGALLPAGTIVLFVVCGAIVLLTTVSALAVRDVRRWS